MATAETSLYMPTYLGGDVDRFERPELFAARDAHATTAIPAAIRAGQAVRDAGTRMRAGGTREAGRDRAGWRITFASAAFAVDQSSAGGVATVLRQPSILRDGAFAFSLTIRRVYSNIPPGFLT